MADENSHTLHEITQKFSELGSKTNSVANRASESLLKYDIYPKLVSTTDVFVHDYVVPTLDFLSKGNESVRENLAKYLKKSFQAIGNTELDSILVWIVPVVYKRLEDENSEFIIQALLDLLLTIMTRIGPSTNPVTWDKYFVPPANMTKGLIKCLEMDSPDIKKLVSKLIIALAEKLQMQTIKDDAPRLNKAILRNTIHNQQEVRRLSVAAITAVYLKAGITDDLNDKVYEIFIRLSMDRAACVRKELIKSLKVLLTEHLYRDQVYNPLVIVLLYLMQPIVPLRPTSPGPFKPQQPQKLMLEEAESAYDALQAIGLQHIEDKADEYHDEVEHFEDEEFDSTRTFNLGLRHILRDNCERFLNNLLPKIIEWKADSRKFGYGAIKSLLHFVKDYATRMCPQLFNNLYVSLRDHPETDDALQTAAIIASSVPGSELIKAIVLRDGVNKPWLLLLKVITLNAEMTDGDLDLVRQNLQEREAYEQIDCLESYVELLLVMIEQHQEFADRNAVSLLNLILKGCERADALGPFENAFGRPISIVFSEHLRELLNMGDGSPTFLRHFLLTSPPQSVLNNQDAVLPCLIKALTRATSENKAKLHILINDMAKAGCFHDVEEEFVDAILSDMEWKVGKENYASRTESTIAFGVLIETGSMKQETIANIEKLLPALLSDYDDTWCDSVRLAAIQSIVAYIKACPAEILKTKWDDLWKAIKDRLNDTNIQVRTGSARILEVLVPLMNGLDTVKSAWDDMFLFIDDSERKVQEAMKNVALSAGSIPEWKESIVASMKSHLDSTSNTLSKQIYQEIISKLQ